MIDVSKNNGLKLCAISMVRNEADIIVPFLNQMATLFDRVFIVDIQSTDGTQETISAFAEMWPHVELYTCKTQERYQSAMMNILSRKAVGDGADWVFFLDADEFVNVEGKSALHDYLHAFPHDVMHLPWANLIPTAYGSFDAFDANQDYFWSGRVSSILKVAVSAIYMNAHPDFHIQEGNHDVCPRRDCPPVNEQIGLNLLHVPVRSAERLKYKASNARRLMESKHNNGENEGNHVTKILSFIMDGRVRPENLNIVVANYGVNDEGANGLAPKELGWPIRSMPAYLFEPRSGIPVTRGLAETFMRDAALVWDKPDFVKGCAVGAQIDGTEIRIVCQPMKGDGTPYDGRFKTIPAANPEIPEKLSMNLLIDCMSTTFLRIDVMRFSAWSRLIPVLFALFSILRPRRYVELGVHNGMSFFAACQVAEHLNIHTQCVAVDSWVGDEHASFHTSDVFDTFRATIAKRYPQQYYVQGFFSDALKSFDSKSVDLLHIDGYHTYEAVKDDFETWLPKMSGSGVIIFHDINVHERGFGVWRFWSELKEKYPAFSFFHSHGLGILYVGSSSGVVADLFAQFDQNPDFTKIAQQYFELMGEMSVEHRTVVEEAKSNSELLETKDEKLAELRDIVEKRDTQLDVARNEIASIRNALLNVWKKSFDRRNINRFRTRKNQKIVLESGLFDRDYYLNAYDDVRLSGMDPIAHFVRFGFVELRNPNSTFDTASYLLKNRDVMDAKINPFIHYILYGKRENRAL
ncbi:class I SAM-dependent methyltransferase [Bosea sp. NBC_00550]|uniref:class I SAM-dependent methyltransferase n=1 Tax=Bosea sp. NBC_00550 TaxID=2969621 RepID=UPI00222E55F2|nr:class I SAM-dependent methyltransferase [Bosea sp. NBC_00550]UZF91299.1 class I SAM-dependent methyltransferase [Bosea sp. NBC_00550]